MIYIGYKIGYKIVTDNCILWVISRVLKNRRNSSILKYFFFLCIDCKEMKRLNEKIEWIEVCIVIVGFYTFGQLKRQLVGG